MSWQERLQWETAVANNHTITVHCNVREDLPEHAKLSETKNDNTLVYTKHRAISGYEISFHRDVHNIGRGVGGKST